MTKAFFSLGFGQPGCIPDSTFGTYAISTRRELVDAIKDAIAFYELPASLLGTISIRRTWAHAKRFGLSSVFLELSTASMKGCLLFMGQTEAEYEAASEADCF